MSAAEFTALHEERLNALRERLFVMIERHLAEDPHCKSYEGAVEIVRSYPNVWEHRAGDQPEWKLHLHCYVIGGSRHHEFVGNTAGAVLDLFESWIDNEAAEIERERAEDARALPAAPESRP